MSKYLSLLAFICIFISGCGETEVPQEDDAFVINEVVSNNDGVNIDEKGQTEDWIEIANISDNDLSLKGFFIADSSAEKFPLPDVVIRAHSVLLLWADDDTKDGVLHLPFKLSSSGDKVSLYHNDGTLVDTVNIPALDVNQAYARFPSRTGSFDFCRYATPSKNNGLDCEPPTVVTIEDELSFNQFDKSEWPDFAPQGLAINEVAIFPSRFIEVKNYGVLPVNAKEYQLTATPKKPDFTTKISYLPLPDIELNPGEVLSVDIPIGFLNQIEDSKFNEAVVVLSHSETLGIVDSVPFMHWPQGSSLARLKTSPYPFHFCVDATKNTDNDCVALASRDVGDYVRGLYTPGDFKALAVGEGKANIESVKFVIDLENDSAVYFLGSERWPLHYTFVRQVIEDKAELNRCVDAENSLFNEGWYEFSVDNYFNNSTRRYHLGTLSKHANANLNNIEFTFGDYITGSQMKEAFYRVTQFVGTPYIWSLRPQDAEQVLKAKQVEGELPIVTPKAPFKNIVFQGLSPGLAYGTLMYVTTEDLVNTTLGNRIIVITNDVPNDIDFVAGLITEAFQTPLAHVNILSQSRNTPNMALPGASGNPQFKALLGKLVRLEVSAGGYTVAEASQSEAQAFWDSQIQQTPVLSPRLDSHTQGLVDLVDASIDSLPGIGAKAAQMAELFKIKPITSVCREGGAFAYPVGAFAIPMSYYLNHFEKSGASSYLQQLLLDELFNTDSGYRKLALQTLRQKFFDYPVDVELIKLVESWVEPRFGKERVRFRSSSNTEDLADFNGAGLYESISAELGSQSRPIDFAIQTVWASLWSLRAYEERLYANVDQTNVAMAVLVHAAFTNERANGVAVARNILDPTRSDQYYFNTQAGEASVTNPAPSVMTEQLIYQWPTRTPTLTYQSNSSLIDGAVIKEVEVRALACALEAVQEHFRGILDPLGENRWFTMETEFKFLGKERTLLLKQARPYKFGRLDIPNDCREL